MMNRHRIVLFLSFALVMLAGYGHAADRFYISIPGPTLSYVPLYYGQEKGFFAQGRSWCAFLRAWNRGLKAYQESPNFMIPFIQ